MLLLWPGLSQRILNVRLFLTIWRIFAVHCSWVLLLWSHLHAFHWSLRDRWPRRLFALNVVYAAVLSVCLEKIAFVLLLLGLILTIFLIHICFSFHKYSMFGYLLVSNDNQVLFYGGDSHFDSYLHGRLFAEGLYSSDSPSTSSGVYSDSSTESLCTHEDSSSTCNEARIPEKSPNQEISHLFLPLISIYRSFNSRTNDNIYSTTSDQVTILMKRLKYDYLLISMGSRYDI